MQPPAVRINVQGGLLWGGHHVCLKERDGKEGAGVRGEEEGIEPHVISLSSMSSHHCRDFLG